LCRTIPAKGETVLAMAAALEDWKQSTERALLIAELEVGMRLEVDVFTSTGQLILSRGRPLMPFDLELLRNFAERVGIVEPIKVKIPNRRRDS